MKRTNIYIPKQQLEALDKLERETGISRSEHVRIAITEYLRKKQVRILIDSKEQK